VLEDIKARHLTVTNYGPVLDRVIEKNPEYILLINPSRPGSWPKSHRDAAVGHPAPIGNKDASRAPAEKSPLEGPIDEHP
jgi:hypothetical protein